MANKTLSFAVSEEEYTQVKEKAGENSISKFLKEMLLNYLNKKEDFSNKKEGKSEEVKEIIVRKQSDVVSFLK